jgi:hypothetical protein
VLNGGRMMFSSSECRLQAAEKIAQAECEPQNRTRLLAAAEAWLVLADQMARRESTISVTGRARSRKRAVKAAQLAASPS